MEIKVGTQRKLALAQGVLAIGIILFWVFFFLGNEVSETPVVCYREFESAFPLPDLVLALTLLISAWGHWWGKRFGAILSLAAAGALIFLGLIDVSFNIGQGVYQQSLFHAILNGSINVICIGFGLFVIVRTLRDPLPGE